MIVAATSGARKIRTEISMANDFNFLEAFMEKNFAEDLKNTIEFHGHLCPGLALGYRVAKAALRELDSCRPEDEELVAIVENDSCAADAIQFITGCTFGKGNFLFRDYGKHIYTFFNRRTGKGVRISEDYRGFEADEAFQKLKKRQDDEEDVAREMHTFKMEKTAAILQADEADIMAITLVTSQAPQAAKIHGSARCASCGEKFMESRGRVKKGKIICIPCFNAQ
jgi:formylmethanofuran dehydrogenase subunit E